MICFARSGGTILNRCLGSLPNAVMLSELNPLGGGSKGDDTSCRTVRSQAKNWYGIDVDTDDYVEGILRLEKICEATGRRLIVRDWPFVNFCPFADNGMVPPDRLLILEALKGRCEMKPFAFVRDAIDVWISRGCKPHKAFFEQYLNYLTAVCAEGMPVFKYEEFCDSPGKVIKSICEYAGLEYGERYKEFPKFTKYNGDLKGAGTEEIKPLKRQRIKWKKIWGVNRCAEMKQAQAMMGYPASYWNGDTEKSGLMRCIEGLFD